MGINADFGRKGEELAVRYLTEIGYTIVARNYRFRKAEIDILAQKGAVLAVVEVKARSSSFITHIEQTVSKKKIALLVEATNAYIAKNDLEVDVRFDIITIRKTKSKYTITHIKDAFYHF